MGAVIGAVEGGVVGALCGVQVADLAADGGIMTGTASRQQLWTGGACGGVVGAGFGGIIGADVSNARWQKRKNMHYHHHHFLSHH